MIFAQGYTLVGKGWCLDDNGDQINNPGFSWSTTVVKSDGSAAQCESTCSSDATCIGYMTEDETKCDVILSTDEKAINGIQKVDSETRNNCWRKVPGKLLL